MRPLVQPMKDQNADQSHAGYLRSFNAPMFDRALWTGVGIAWDSVGI